jgi:hypothetical protein
MLRCRTKQHARLLVAKWRRGEAVPPDVEEAIAFRASAVAYYLDHQLTKETPCPTS